MDAQHNDVLKFYGLPLTGGDANGGVAGLAINGLVGSAIGFANILQGNLQDPTRGIYQDHLLPWMTYGFKYDAEGNLDMYVTNQFDQLFRAVFGLDSSALSTPSDGALNGWMKIENVDIVGSRLGAGQFGLEGEGSLGMVFRAVNPLQALLPVLNLVPGAIGAALYYSVYADTLLSTVAATQRFAKALEWSAGAGELVSLDALGVVSISLASQSVGVTTPQGARLLAGSEVTFDGGRVSHMFEAIFSASDTDTRYAGDTGRAVWQSADRVNAKGFGTVHRWGAAAPRLDSGLLGVAA